LEEIMERVLQDVNAVVGVTGSFVCNTEGTLVARALPSVFDEGSFLPAARTILQTIEGLETTRRRRVHEIDLVFGEGRMVVKNLRVGCVYILCVRTINVPLLNLTANVAARKLTEMLKEREPSLPSAPARPAEAEAEEVVAVEELPTDAADLLLARGRQAVAAAEEQGVHLRLLGGIAVKAVCPSAADITLPPDGLDLDLAIYGRQRRELDKVLEGVGYEPHRRFNALYGHRRLKYSESEQGLTLDVFVDTFHMCHQLPFANRLELHDETLPLADLLLSKLQIVQMGEKDLRDIYAILYDYELGAGSEADRVDTDFITSICGDDWGWYKTVTLNIEKSIDLAHDFLPDQQTEVYTSRAGQLREIVESAPKSLRWQARARIGEARRWYDLPEE
jgi:predicted regulator of Ras-like GTPase activity (Roadblock/LC7/MglB family)